ncbi:hypothetical protein ACPA9J_16980 [Pseudomonas aeruginosa]
MLVYKNLLMDSTLYLDQLQKAIAITGGIVLALTAVATAIGVVLAAFGMIASGIGSFSLALASVGGIAGIAAGAVGFLGSALQFNMPIGLLADSYRNWCCCIKAYQKATEQYRIL